MSLFSDSESTVDTIESTSSYDEESSDSDYTDTLNDSTKEDDLDKYCSNPLNPDKKHIDNER